ncbi:phosphotransferase [Amycolatopsis sp. NPDC023774]|uniref:protein kinase domain-containing protein n=1 Tax=Amycolatopsis sp. NPDC023774 TaxID=3155015 RepID=UPI003411113F
MTVGRYEVEHLIGSGGTARVYRAFDRRLGHPVALKVYDRDVVAVDQVRRLRKKTIQAGIDHPGVVAELDSGTDHSRPFLVMQLVDGGNLAERLLAGPLPAAEVSELGVRLAESLAGTPAHPARRAPGPQARQYPAWRRRPADRRFRHRP